MLLRYWQKAFFNKLLADLKTFLPQLAHGELAN
jgi:hypothetical protein